MFKIIITKIVAECPQIMSLITFLCVCDAHMSYNNCVCVSFYFNFIHVSIADDRHLLKNVWLLHYFNDFFASSMFFCFFYTECPFWNFVLYFLPYISFCTYLRHVYAPVLFCACVSLSAHACFAIIVSIEFSIYNVWLL